MSLKKINPIKTKSWIKLKVHSSILHHKSWSPNSASKQYWVKWNWLGRANMIFYPLELPFLCVSSSGVRFLFVFLHAHPEQCLYSQEELVWAQGWAEGDLVHIVLSMHVTSQGRKLQMLRWFIKLNFQLQQLCHSIRFHCMWGRGMALLSPHRYYVFHSPPERNWI